MPTAYFDKSQPAATFGDNIPSNQGGYPSVPSGIQEGMHAHGYGQPVVQGEALPDDYNPKANKI